MLDIDGQVCIVTQLIIVVLIICIGKLVFYNTKFGKFYYKSSYFTKWGLDFIGPIKLLGH